MKLLLASKNLGKLRELRELLVGLPCEIEAWAGELPEEVGATLEENAKAKALAVMRSSGLPALGDDTGLEVVALHGAPGVRSARYAGSTAANIARLLRELRDVPLEQRTACFRNVLCLALPDGRTHLVEGRLDGRIALEPAGVQGFGYDPVFLLPGQGKTLAELSQQEKNRISHRACAVARMRPILELWAAET